MQVMIVVMTMIINDKALSQNNCTPILFIGLKSCSLLK
jgi:hypothetical protein